MFACGEQTGLDPLLLPPRRSTPWFQTFPRLFPTFSGAPGLCILRCAVSVEFVRRVIFLWVVLFCFHLLFVGRERKRRRGGTDAAG